MSRALNWVSRIDARHRLFFAIFLSVAVFLVLRGRTRVSTELIATWDVFAFCMLGLAWLTIITTPTERLRLRAKEQDLSRTVIFIFVLVTACVGLFAVGFLLRTQKGETQGHLSLHVLLTLAAVVASWLLVHTVFSLRYAHTFYGESDDPKAKEHAGGLIFPGDRAPDYMDFAYFSFVIGMTFQVSDVVIVSRKFRQLVLLHSALAFGFNTVILALAINTVLGLV